MRDKILNLACPRLAFWVRLSNRNRVLDLHMDGALKW